MTNIIKDGNERPQFSSYNGTLSNSFQIGTRGVKILQGTKYPESNIGKDGDLFIMISASDSNLLQKRSGSWVDLESNKNHNELLITASSINTVAKREDIVFTGRTLSDEERCLSAGTFDSILFDDNSSIILKVKLIETPKDIRGTLPFEHSEITVRLNSYFNDEGEKMIHFETLNDMNNLIKIDTTKGTLRCIVNGTKDKKIDWAAFVEVFVTTSL